MHILVDDLRGAEIRELLEEHLQSMYALSPARSVHALDLDALRKPGITFWTAREGALLLGCGALKELDARSGEVKSMRTPAALRRRGAGRALLAHIIAVARSRGYARLSLETGSAEAFAPARRLYESAGFAYCGPFADYVEDPNSVFLRLDLAALHPAPAPLGSAFRYKTWADAELLAAVGALDPLTRSQERHAALRTLNHIFVVDRIFAAHLSGGAHDYAATNTPETPELERLRADLAQSDAWYESFVEHAHAAHLAQPVHFTFTDGQAGRMSREEMLLHVLTHGSYHRGAVGRLLDLASAHRPADTFTVFLHRTEPARRTRG